MTSDKVGTKKDAFEVQLENVRKALVVSERSREEAAVAEQEEVTHLQRELEAARGDLEDRVRENKASREEIWRLDAE